MNYISETQSQQWKEKNDAFQKVKKAEKATSDKIDFEEKYGKIPDLQGEFVTPIKWNEIEPTNMRKDGHRKFRYLKDTDHDGNKTNDFFIVKKHETGDHRGKKYRIGVD